MMNRLLFPFATKPEMDENGVRYAEVYTRSVAAAIDLALLYFVLDDLFRYMTARIMSHVDRDALQAMQGARGAGATLQGAWAAHVPQLWLINTAVQIAIIGVIYVAVQCLWFTTPGKWVMGLKIVKYPSQERPKRWQFIVRYVGYVISSVPLMLGLIWSSFNKQHRCWHDFMAGTAVIYTRPHMWFYKDCKKLIRKLWVKWRGKDSDLLVK